MIDAYDPNAPEELVSSLGTYDNAYWNDFLDYWQLKHVGNASQYAPDERAYHAKLNEVAVSIRRLLHTLTPDKSVTDAIERFFGASKLEGGWSPDVTALVAQALHTTFIVRDSIRIDLAME